MDKYTGCNVVDSIVTTPPKSETKVNGRSNSGAVWRWIIAIAVIGMLLAFKYAPIDIFSTVKSVLSNVFCLDYFGRTDVGSIPIISMFIK